MPVGLIIREKEQEASGRENDTLERNTKQAILVVSFGTSYNGTRDKTIGEIERTIAKSFSDFDVRRAFTSQIIIDKLRARDGLEIDNVEQALERACRDGIDSLIVQPTHMMAGYEYTDLADVLESYEKKFRVLALAEPLLSREDDFVKVIRAITDETASCDDGETAICYMGHGTEADSNKVYLKLQDMLRDRGYGNYYVGTVEAEPSLKDLMASVKEKGCYKKIVLKPLMVVAGDHANNDMAGDEADSWKRRFEAAGYEVRCILKGLGENSEIREIYAAHVKRAYDSLEK